jgi:hypothetical protein
MPECPNFHQVSSAASKDENPKKDEHPVERHVLSLANKISKSNGNGKISERDQGVRNNMQRDQVRPPKIAISMRHETAGGKEVIDEIHDGPPIRVSSFFQGVMTQARMLYHNS